MTMITACDDSGHRAVLKFQRWCVAREARPLFEPLDQPEQTIMTGTTAKAHLYDRLLESLRGCEDLNVYRHNLMKWVMSMPDLEVREHLEYLELNHQASF